MSRLKELKPEQPKQPKPPKQPKQTPGPNGPSADAGVTRRTFALGTAAVAAVAGAVSFIGSRLFGGGGKKGDDPSTEPVVVDSGDATSITEEFEQVDAIRLQLRASYDLPLGSILAPAEGQWLPVVQQGATSAAMCSAAAFRMSDGAQVVVVPQPIKTTPNALILDVRCSDSVYAWSEVDIADRSWTLYASAWRDGVLTGQASTLWEGDANWDPPAFVCTGDQVLWQVQPALTGEKTAEFSSLYRWRSGDSSAEKVYESQGRFACEPAVGNSTVTIVPRVSGEGGGVYYGITALDKTDLSKVVDTLVMPQSVRPYRACRIGDVFAFSVEATYGTGGLLSNMGYYLGTSTGHITWLSREPAASVWGYDGAYVFKARASYIVYDSYSSQFSVLVAADHAVDYGEYPASSGDTPGFVTFATIKDSGTGYPAKVLVRVYDTITPEQAENNWRASLPADDPNSLASQQYGEGVVVEGAEGADAAAAAEGTGEGSGEAAGSETADASGENSEGETS